MNIEPLQKIGLTQGEIKVYLALFHLGTTTAGPIAKEAKVARSKLYDILDRLAKRGIVSHIIKNGTKYFSVAQPSRLLDFLRQKEEELEEQKIAINNILPMLEQEYELQKVKHETEVYEGLEGLKNVREEALHTMKSGDCVYFFGVSSDAYTNMLAYYSDWNDRRIKKGIRSYTIFNDEARTHEYVKKKLNHKNTAVRFLPKGIFTRAWVEIYGDITVIAIHYKKPMSIVIHNKYVSESYKQYFDLLWKISKP